MSIEECAFVKVKREVANSNKSEISFQPKEPPVSFDLEKMPVYHSGLFNREWEVLDIENRPRRMMAHQTSFAVHVSNEKMSSFLKKGDLVYMDAWSSIPYNKMVYVVLKEESELEYRLTSFVAVLKSSSLDGLVFQIDAKQKHIKREDIASLYVVLGWVSAD